MVAEGLDDDAESTQAVLQWCPDVVDVLTSGFGADCGLFDAPCLTENCLSDIHLALMC